MSAIYIKNHLCVILQTLFLFEFFRHSVCIFLWLVAGLFLPIPYLSSTSLLRKICPCFMIFVLYEERKKVTLERLI